MEALGATLKKGGYRSAGQYITAYKVASLRQGFEWSTLLQQCLRDVTRSCERGVGPPTRARPLPLESLGLLP